MAELNITRKNIRQALTDTLSASGKSRFVVPEYQRPYSWDIDKCETLWSDVLSFYMENHGNTEEYFLGTIIFCIEDSEIAIIDGQQRLTSLFLLLRAFYQKLEGMHNSMPNDRYIHELMTQIAPCIWDTNKESKEVEDKSRFHLASRVATESDNDILHQILTTGNISESDKSNYAVNYRHFQKKCREYAEQFPNNWRDLCLCFMERCIILPIECKNLDSALTIFSTLNDRGMPLSDSDIFKAKLYRFHENNQKENFIQKWRQLSETLEIINLPMDDIFRYHTHYIRAKNSDKSKEIGLRKFYSANNYELLKSETILDDLIELSEFWVKLYQFDDSVCTLETKQLIQCFQRYPNEFWKYAITVFYYKNKENIKETLPSFLKNLLSFLFVKFIEHRTVNSIKDPIYQECIEIYKNGTANFRLASLPSNFRESMNDMASTRLETALLLLHTYIIDKNQPMLPSDFQIEHIFPQKWNKTYFTWNEQDANDYINKLGNKIPLEKKLNIQASNGFFSAKKEKYRNSSVHELQSIIKENEWYKNQIDKRNENILTDLENFFCENLLNEEITRTILLQVTARDIKAEVYELKKPHSVSYQTVINDETYNSSSMAEALYKIDAGLLKYGEIKYLSDEMNDLIHKV